MTTPLKSSLIPHLHNLGLSKIPELEELREQFTRLLKEFHPDRNLNRKEWAHEKTMKIINSHRHIQEYLTRSETEVAQEEDWIIVDEDEPESDEPQYSVVDSAPNDHNGQVLFQLIESEDGNYAIPLERIERVVAPHQINYEFRDGLYYFRQGACEYALFSLLSQPLTSEQICYIFLFKSKVINYGIAISGSMKVGGIESFASKEQVYVSSHESYERGWVMHRNGKYYLFPERLLEEVTIKLLSREGMAS